MFLLFSLMKIVYLTRMKIWAAKGQAERTKVFMEEWLTDFRAKLLKKCKKLLVQGWIENVKTKSGDIIVLYKNKTDGQLNKKVIIYQEDYDQLLGLVGKIKDEKLDVSKLDIADAALMEEELLEEEKVEE